MSGSNHRVALAVAAFALVLLFCPIECATAMGAGSESSTSCTSAVGLRLPIEAGPGIVLGGIALLAVVDAVLRRRRP